MKKIQHAKSTDFSMEFLEAKWTMMAFLVRMYEFVAQKLVFRREELVASGV